MKHITPQDLEAQSASIRKEFYQKFLTEGDVVYDLGAFRGVLTVAFAELGYRVFAIEGSARNYEFLVDNVKDFPNVTTILMALHEKNEDGVQTRFNDCISREHPLQTVSYRTLPSLMSDFKLPDPKLIKMDIEGMETLVLKQCQDIFQRIRPVWQLSVHHTHPHAVECVYDGFPGFVTVDKGGFDFNTIFGFDYLAFNLEGVPQTIIDGFEEYFLVPKELAHKCSLSK